MKYLVNLIVMLSVAFYLSGNAFAAEHPGTGVSEHPGETAAEHPGAHVEHPGEHAEHPGEAAMLSAKDIIKGIKHHIDGVTAANNGIFPLSDPEEGKSLSLKLQKVHEDKVSYIKKDDAYFACTDFVTVDGTTAYDVDFWMKKRANGKLSVYQTKIHKKDRNPRFMYKDDEIVEVE